MISLDWYPLWNSLRIAAISTVIIFFLGILAAYYVAKLPRLVKGVLDVVLTLPLVMSPTVVGYFLLRLLGPKRTIGLWFLQMFDLRLTMVWYSAVFASAVVAFPLMYRTARGAFESFDMNLAYAGQTLGRSNTWIFWRVRMPCCKQGIIAGTVLAFARALGEYGATSMISGYTPGKTATISTTVYQLWRTGDDAGAMRWVLVNLAISAVVLLAVNMTDGRRETKSKVENFIKETGYTMTVLLDSDQELAEYFGIRYIPSTFVINKDGKLTGQIQGGTTKAAVMKLVEEAKK